MKSLRILSLEGTELSDEGVSHLRGLTNLEDLDLASTTDQRCRARASEGIDQARGTESEPHRRSRMPAWLTLRI